MSEDIGHLDFPTPDPDNPEAEVAESGTDVDPGTLASLDQEQQAARDASAEFARMYGFVHDCHCAEDYEKGNTTNVSNCFVDLCNQALAVLQFSNMENKQLRLYLQQMMKMNNDLAEMLKERGFSEDLEKYFTEEITEEDETAEVIDLEVVEDETETEDSDDGDDEALTIG